MFVSFLFYLSSALTLAGALGVLFTRNIMYACISLLCSLIGVAGLYVTLGADLVAVTQTMVYVGGVVILMLFAVMLTGGKDFKSRMQVMFNYPDAMGNKWTYGVGIAAALVFLAYSAQLIWKIIQSATKPEVETFKSTVEDIGISLISEHVLAFEISSVLLLGALMGAAIIARPKKIITDGEDS